MLNESTYLLPTLLSAALAGLTGGIMVARGKWRALIPLLIIYEGIALFLMATSGQSVLLGLLEHAIAFTFLYWLATSMRSMPKASRTAMLALVFASTLVLLKPFRIYLLCGYLYVCT